ncbi:hypothetical protein [Nocardia sp. IFM 10818]
MTVQEKINSIGDQIAYVRDLVVKIRAEIQWLKTNPQAEYLDFKRVDALLENLKAHAEATDTEIPDLPK